MANRPSIYIHLVAIFVALAFLISPLNSQSQVKPAATTPTGKQIASPKSILPTIVVHKDPNCSCCHAWVTHLQQSGFRVVVKDETALGSIKDELGVPANKRSCHTATVAGYFIEGHVPADDIIRLITEKPQAKGLALPGMPIGSPGMEVSGVAPQAYAVDIIHVDGTATQFAQH